MVSSLGTGEGAAASPCAAVPKNADEGDGRTIASPVRHMHRDVAELLLAAGSTPRRRRRKMPTPAPRARYGCAFEEEAPGEAEEDGGFAPPQMVWAKVRGHPWWPGQVFDPADASAEAERQTRRRDAVLVAFFGDRTFAWAGAEDLLPLRHGFPRLADVGGRTNSCKFAFAPALEDALDEVSRRVDAGLSCGCRAAAGMKQVVQSPGFRTGARGGAARMRQVVRNSGVRRGARGADAGDAAFARDALRGEAFVRYVRALALVPEAGADMLDLAVASAQMKAFARWRSAANPEPDSTAGVDDVSNGAMVVAPRAGRGRATTPRRDSTSRGLFRCDAPDGDMTVSMRERAAAADAAFMRHMFPGDALEEYASAMTVTPPPAVAELRGLAVVATTPQRKSFDEWRGASPRGGFTKCTAICGITGIAAMDAATPPPARRATPTKTARSTGGDDADADPGNCVTSCISSGEDSACENDGDDDAASETESEDFEPASEWELGWKDYVIVMQFLAIVLLVCQLIQ